MIFSNEYSYGTTSGFRISLINTKWKAFECDKEKTMKSPYFLDHYFLNQLQGYTVVTATTITVWAAHVLPHSAPSYLLFP